VSDDELFFEKEQDAEAQMTRSTAEVGNPREIAERYETLIDGVRQTAHQINDRMKPLTDAINRIASEKGRLEPCGSLPALIPPALNGTASAF